MPIMVYWYKSVFNSLRLRQNEIPEVVNVVVVDDNAVKPLQLPATLNVAEVLQSHFLPTAERPEGAVTPRQTSTQNILHQNHEIFFKEQ